MGKLPFRVEAVLPESARTYFLERDSAAFRSLLAKGDSTFVRLVTRPDFANWVPKGVQGQANAKAIEFHDIIEYNPALIERPPFRINVKTESPFLGDKLDVRLELVIEEVDENTCRQVLQGYIRVNMFGVGRIVESIVKDSLTNTYKKLPEIVRRWQTFRAEALLNGNANELLSGRPPVGQNIKWIRAEVLQILQSPIEAEGVSPQRSPSTIATPSLRAILAGEEPEQQQQLAMALIAPAAAPAAEGATTEPATAIVAAAVSAAEVFIAAAGAATSAVEKYSFTHTGVEYADAVEGLGPGAGHRRNTSLDSAASSGDIAFEGAAGDVHSPFQKRPTSQKTWRGFNDKYDQWSIYWDAMGVKHMAPREPPSGPLAFLYRAQDSLKSSASTLMMTIYLLAMRKGFIAVQPNEDGRYAGKAPRLELHTTATTSGAAAVDSQPASPGPDPAAHTMAASAANSPWRLQEPIGGRPLHRHLSVPQAQQMLRLDGDGGAGAEAGSELAQHGHRGQHGRTGVFPPLLEEPGSFGDDFGEAHEHSAAYEYGNPEAAAALLSIYTQRRIPAHRRAVSVDTGTAAAAAAASQSAAAGNVGSATDPGSRRATRQQQQQQQQHVFEQQQAKLASGVGLAAAAMQGRHPKPGTAKRSSTAIPLSSQAGSSAASSGGPWNEDDRVHPPARFSCLPVCWHRGRRRATVSHGGNHVKKGN
ncbi:hypothetical protein N2152v2_010962 [Parachlorella kessleri]